MNRRRGGLSTVVITLRSSLIEDKGIGIVIMRNPMTLLVPHHLVAALEEDSTTQVAINGEVYDRAMLLRAPELERDELAILRVKGHKLWPLSCARIPREEVRLYPGQSILLGGASASQSMTRKGRIVEIRERTDGTTVVTDIPVSAGDSGSAVVIDRQLVAVCQGMLPSEKGGAAIAMPLSRASIERLWKLRREPILRRGVPAVLAMVVCLAFGILGAVVGDAPSVFSQDAPTQLPGEGLRTVEGIRASLPTRALIIRNWLASLGNDSPEDGTSNYAVLIPPDELGAAIGGMRWSSPDPTDLTCWISSWIPSDATGIEVVVSASTEMRMSLQFATNCDYSSALYPKITATPRRFIFPFSSWNGATDYRCNDATAPSPGDYLDRIMLLPTANTGEFRVYSISFSYE